MLTVNLNVNFKKSSHHRFWSWSKEKLWNSQDYTDVPLAAVDNQQIQAHRVVLSSNDPILLIHHQDVEVNLSGHNELQNHGQPHPLLTHLQCLYDLLQQYDMSKAVIKKVLRWKREELIISFILLTPPSFITTRIDSRYDYIIWWWTPQQLCRWICWGQIWRNDP